MSECPRERYLAPRSKETADPVGTPRQREAYWVAMVCGDAEAHGYDCGLAGVDPEGVELCRDEFAWKFTPPDDRILAAYRLGWDRGATERAGHPA